MGTHWAPALAAALAAAHSLGVQMADAARVARQTPPYTGRMEAISLPNGAVLIRDHYNGSIDTVEASFAFYVKPKQSGQCWSSLTLPTRE